MARSLAGRPEIALEIESFARLYPRWLYPGEGDRDPASNRELPFPVRYSIDTLNPLSWRTVATRVTARGAVAVIPAWTFFVAPALGTIAARLRRAGAPVVTIVHNVADHEGRSWKSWLSNRQLSASDAFVTHSEQLAKQLVWAGHAQPIAVVPHPAYNDAPAAKGLLPRERALELLCFGLVRRYKGVDIALRALARSGRNDIRLTIAGEIWEGREELRRLACSPALAGKVEIIDRYVSEQEAAELFARSDALLAPFRAVTGSGVLATAQHYRKPVITSDLPGIAGLVEHGRTGWLFRAGDEEALAGLLRSDVTRESAAAIQEALDRTPACDGWASYADTILRLADIAARRAV